MIADAAFAWTFVPTEPYAGVAAIQDLVTGLGAWWTITGFMAKLIAALVPALPGTGLLTRSTSLSTELHAFTVNAAVLTRSPTGRAITSTRLFALVSANQEALTFVKTGGVEASLITLSTATLAGMATF